MIIMHINYSVLQFDFIHSIKLLLLNYHDNAQYSVFQCVQTSTSMNRLYSHIVRECVKIYRA